MSFHHLQWKFKLLVVKFTWGNKTKHYTTVQFTSFQSSGFITDIAVNPLESKLANPSLCIAGWCQQTFENKFVYNAQQCFAFTPQANFPIHNLNFHWRWWDQIQATFSNLFYFNKVRSQPQNLTFVSDTLSVFAHCM